jgi:hypothetical protein
LKQFAKNARTESERPPNVSEAPTLPLSLSLSLTPTPPQVAKKSKTKNPPLAVPATPEPEKANAVIGLYFELYENRYRGKAPLTGKHFSLIKGVVKSNGVERASQLLRSYFEMPDAYFLKRRHDVETFNANLNQIAHYADTGSVMTNHQLRQADEQIANKQLLKSFED